MIAAIKRNAGTLTGIGLVLAAFIVGLAWCLASPIGSSPDDDYHMASIWCPPPIASSGCVTGTDAEGVSGVVVPALLRDSSACYAFHAEVPADCMSAVSTTETVLSTRVDQGAYPPYYYRFMHLFVGADVTVSILLMRLVNVCLAVALGTLALLVADAASRGGWGFALIGSLVPLGLFLVASVNPSSWAITGIAVLALSMNTLLTAARAQAIAASSVLVVVGSVMAAGSRVDAAIYVILTVGALSILHGLGAYAKWSRLAAPILSILLAAWSFVAIGATGVPSGGVSRDPALTPLGVLTRNILEFPDFFLRLFSNLGWMDTIMPPLVRVTAGLVAGSLLVIGLGRLNLRKAVALLAVGVPIVALPLVMAQRQLLLLSGGDFPQPRYVLPLLPVLIFIALTPTGAPVPFGRGQRTAVWALIVAAQTVGLLTNIRRYTTGVGGGGTPALEAQWWWPIGPGPLTLWALGSLAFAAAAAGLLGRAPSHSREALRTGPPPARTPSGDWAPKQQIRPQETDA